MELLLIRFLDAVFLCMIITFITGISVFLYKGKLSFVEIGKITIISFFAFHVIIYLLGTFFTKNIDEDKK